MDSEPSQVMQCVFLIFNQSCIFIGTQGDYKDHPDDEKDKVHKQVTDKAATSALVLSPHPAALVHLTLLP